MYNYYLKGCRVKVLTVSVSQKDVLLRCQYVSVCYHTGAFSTVIIPPSLLPVLCRPDTSIKILIRAVIMRYLNYEVMNPSANAGVKCRYYLCRWLTQCLLSHQHNILLSLSSVFSFIFTTFICGDSHTIILRYCHVTGMDNYVYS
jgi:hypothetical protein